MNGNTALGFLAAGFSVIFLSGRQRGWALGCSLTVALLGLATMIECLAGLDLGIDQLLFADPGETLHPGRMALATAMNFVSLGGALVLMSVPWAISLAQLLSLATGLVSLLGYLYGVDAFFRAGAGSQFATHTALAFMLMYVAVPSARPDSGLVRLLTVSGPGGAVARWLLPAIFILPPLLGWGRLTGERTGFFDPETGLWFLISSEVVLLTVLVWWSCSALDAVDQARNSKELALRRWEQIFQHAGWGVAIVDAQDDTLQAVNPAFAQLHGCAVEEMIGKSLVETLAPESRKDLPVRLFHLRNNVVYESMHIRKDGSTFPVLTAMTAIRGVGNKILYRAANFQDITERKQAEERFRGLLASAPDAMVITDADGTILLTNQQAGRLFGYAEEEMAGETVEILMPERFRVRYLGRRQGFLNDPRAMASDQDLFGRRKDGSEFPVEVSLSPLRTENGLLVISAIRDITARKQAEGDLRELSGRLLQVQDDERRRIARELHDTTAQNLAALEMNLAVLTESAAGLDLRGREALTESAQLAAQSLQEIRSLSYVLHPPLLDELGLSIALRAYVARLSRTGLQVELQAAADLGRLSDDAEITLFRIVQEALTNVLRHSGSATATVRLVRHDSEVVLEVSDQGGGTPREILERTEEGLGRLGVGLLGMRERARQLGGHLEVESNGRGTTVRATLPATVGV